MLSPRLLQFGRDQVFWDCATMSACETLPDGLPASLDTRAGVDRYWRQRLQDATLTVRPLVETSEGSLERFWENAVRTYTACDLTKPCDRDVAMWGIAKLVRDALGEEYAYGLWSTRVEEQLAWRVLNPATASCLTVSEKTFPSWSWTSLQGTIQVPPRIHDPPRFYRVTNPEGGDIKFQFERTLWGRFEGEHKKLWRQEIPNMDVKLADSKSKRSESQAAKAKSPPIGPRPNPDQASVLSSKEIALKGHICPGTVRLTPEGEGWEFAIAKPGHRQVVFTSHPDVAPSEIETPCEFLLLAASRHFIDCNGRELQTRDCLEGDFIIDEQHFGVGILVKRDGNQLRRVGAVSFREVCKEDWNHFRRACGEGEEALINDLDATTVKEVWRLV